MAWWKKSQHEITLPATTSITDPTMMWSNASILSRVDTAVSSATPLGDRLAAMEFLSEAVGQRGPLALLVFAKDFLAIAGQEKVRPLLATKALGLFTRVNAVNPRKGTVASPSDWFTVQELLAIATWADVPIVARGALDGVEQFLSFRKSIATHDMVGPLLAIGQKSDGDARVRQQALTALAKVISDIPQASMASFEGSTGLRVRLNRGNLLDGGSGYDLRSLAALKLITWSEGSTGGPLGFMARNEKDDVLRGAALDVIQRVIQELLQISLKGPMKERVEALNGADVLLRRFPSLQENPAIIRTIKLVGIADSPLAAARARQMELDYAPPEPVKAVSAFSAPAGESKVRRLAVPENTCRSTPILPSKVEIHQSQSGGPGF